MARRADRLFQIIEILRAAKKPLTADHIADALETSRWTVYRDIHALIGQRVPIRGEAGIGYVLEKGFHLPPLMLTLDELEAIALGTQWVAAHGDAPLALAAREAHGKIAAVLPAGLRQPFEEAAVGTPPARERPADAHVDVARLRTWSRQGLKVHLVYVDEQGKETERTVWPFLVGYVGHVRVLAAWCETREDFRTFRTDRMKRVDFLNAAYPSHRTDLRKRWLALTPEVARYSPA